MFICCSEAGRLADRDLTLPDPGGRKEIQNGVRYTDPAIIHSPDPCKKRQLEIIVYIRVPEGSPVPGARETRPMRLHCRGPFRGEEEKEEADTLH